MRVSFCCPGLEDVGPWLQGLDEALGASCTTLWQPDDPPADYGVVWAPPQSFIDAQPQMKVLFSMGAGVDAMLRLNLPTHLQVNRLEDAGMGVQMAEYVCQAVTRYFRDLPTYEAQMAAGQWHYRAPPSRRSCTVGLLGVGVLGTRVARALQIFEYPVLSWSRTPKTIDGVRSFSGDASLPDFLRETQVLVCLLPLTPQTRGILNAQTFALLRPGAHVINVARGAHLVEQDLLAALASGQLSGATLDVFAQEPLAAGHVFVGNPKITMTPHVAARTLRSETIRQVAEKIRALQRGEAVSGWVQKGHGY